MIDTRLHTLLTLMEAGSYTKAARVLSLTQPAVSHHIRQLEQEYGAPVFYRSTKQLKLTPEGGILVKYARRMQALENNVIKAWRIIATAFLDSPWGLRLPLRRTWCRVSWPPIVTFIQIPA